MEVCYNNVETSSQTKDETQSPNDAPFTKSNKIEENLEVKSVDFEKIKLFMKNTSKTNLFSIMLPTADVFSDLRLILTLYFFTPIKYIKENEEECNRMDFDTYVECVPTGWKSHPRFATALLIPFMLNYILSWLAWTRLERNKQATFIWPVLNLYPQYRAVQVVKLFWTDSERALEEKRELEREFSLTEVFMESIPTTFIITIIWMTVSESVLENNRDRIAIVGPYGHNDEIFFYTTYGLSVFSASFGLAKCLQVGVCRTMGEGGPLGGLLGGRFLLAMLASAAILVSKGAMVALGAPVGFTLYRFFNDQIFS